MGAQTPTPEGQGFLINAKRIRVSRALRARWKCVQDYAAGAASEAGTEE